jgi:hypothetical protein
VSVRLAEKLTRSLAYLHRSQHLFEIVDIILHIDRVCLALINVKVVGGFGEVQISPGGGWADE